MRDISVLCHVCMLRKVRIQLINRLMNFMASKKRSRHTQLFHVPFVRANNEASDMTVRLLTTYNNELLFILINSFVCFDGVRHVVVVRAVFIFVEAHIHAPYTHTHLHTHTGQLLCYLHFENFNLSFYPMFL